MRWVKRIALLGAALLVAGSLLGYIFREELLRLAKQYVQRETQRSILRYGSGLPPVDEVRLLHIEDQPASAGRGTYHIPFHTGPDMTVVAEKTLVGEEAQELARQWRALRLHTQYMAGCYNPHHVVQFRAHGSVVAEAVVCFGCGNTTLPGFPVKVLVSFESLPRNGSPDYLRFRATVEDAVGRHESTPRVSE